MEVFVNTILDQALAKLALSKDINDVVEAFKAIDERLMKAEFVMAVMISHIQDERLWQRFGYSSLSKFLDDLPDVCKVSRQVFTNAANAGKVIRHLSSLLVEPTLQPEFKLTHAVFYRNFTKLQFLYRMMFVWRMPLTNEVLVNFRDMTYRNFESFMNEYEVKNRAVIARIGKLSQKLLQEAAQKPNQKPSQEAAQTKRPKPQPAGVPEINDTEAAICRELRLGRGIGYLASSDPLCAESVRKYLHAERIRLYNETWRGFCALSEIRYNDQPDICLSEMDWAELLPGTLSGSVARLTGLLETGLAPREVKDAFAETFKTRTELTLAQAHIIYRMENDPDLFQSVKDYLLRHLVENRNKSPVMSFASHVFGIEEPRFKMLKRIGSGLSDLADMCRDPDIKGKVRYTAEGFLEKLSYLATAKKNHAPNYRLIADALNTVSAKRFRKFANNRGDDLTDEPITLKDYQAAKPFIDKLQVYQAAGKSISIIGLQLENEQVWLDSINRAMEIGEKQLKKFYPDIVWDPQFHVEYAAGNGSEGGENEQGCLNLAEQASVSDLSPNINNDPMEAVAA